MPHWPKEHNQDKAAKIILFLISPFFAALYSLKTLNRKSSYVVYFLFAVFFGMSFTISRDSEYDGAAYRVWFEEYLLVSQIQFNNLLSDYLTFQGTAVGAKEDFFFDFVSFYLTRITDNYHVMFMVFATIFAYFALKSFRFFTEEIDIKIGITVYILAFLFMYNQIFSINGLRFWTSAWIAIYCVFQIFRNNNNRYFILLLLIPIFHSSYWIFITIILLAFFFRKYEKVWTILFFASFLFSSVSVEIINSNIDVLPSILRRSASKYASQEYIAERGEGSGFIWVSRTMDSLIRVYINAMVYLLIKNAQQIKANVKTENIYLFLLVFMTIVNFGMPVPSFGSRYIQLAYPIIAYIWLVNFRNIQYRRFLYFLPLVFWYKIYQLIFIRYPDITDFSFYISNPISIIYKYLVSA